MKKRKLILILLLILVAIIPFYSVKEAKADDLSDITTEELNQLDFEKIEDFLYENEITLSGSSFFESVSKFIKGEYALDYDNFLNYLKGIFFNKLNEILPIFISVIAVAVFCGLINAVKSKFCSEEIAEIISFICISAIAVILSGLIISAFTETKKVIENLSKLNEIMSPIILTLMVVSGGTVSAGVYKPVVVFLSSTIVNIFLTIILPLISVLTIFNLISNFSNRIKIKKYSDFISGVIKWIIGLIIAVFGIFITVQGLTSASYDGISYKAAKYTISSAVPIIGGFLKDGFDLVACGSVIIKNAVGFSTVFVLFFTIISPIILLSAFSLLLKLTSAITETITDGKISDFCLSLSKSVSLLIVSILVVGFMFFISVLLMILSANVFI